MIRDGRRGVGTAVLVDDERQGVYEYLGAVSKEPKKKDGCGMDYKPPPSLG